MNITPKDYVDASVGLARAGFQAITEMLDEGKSIADVATAFGIDETPVAIVKTTKSYEHYATVARLETEREDLQQELDTALEVEAKVKPKPYHYVIAVVVLIAIVALAIWGIAALVTWLRGL